jgi:hypothetical protein
MSSRFPFYFFLLASFFQVSSLVFVFSTLEVCSILFLTFKNPYLNSSTYIALLNSLWLLPTSAKFINLRFHDKERDISLSKGDIYTRLQSPSLFLGLICFISTLVTFPSYLLTRKHDKLATIFVFATTVSTVVFLLLHYSGIIMP